MIRVNIVCEGQTEENFVKQILAPHLIPLGVNPTPHNLGTGASYQKLKNKVLQWLKEEPTTWVTTMVDLCAMPDDYAGFEENKHKPPLDKIKGLEAAFKADIEKEGLANWRFIPNYQLHEFEALLFSDPKQMELWLGLDFKIEAGVFTAIRDSFETPEAINSNRQQSPSWRIKNLIKSYKKPTHGMVVAKEIGLAKMREECTHFDTWVTALENLAEVP
jgi:hypothetical protein